MNRLLFALVLILSLVIGSGGSYILVNELQASLPEEFVDSVKEDVQQATVINADVINNALKKYSSIVDFMAKYYFEILDNPDSFAVEQSYYHNAPNIASSPNPPTLQFNPIYNESIDPQHASFIFEENLFPETYLDEYVNGTETKNPLDLVSTTTATLLNQTSKIDSLWRELYDIYPEIKWMHLTLQEGITRYFPWRSLNKTLDYRAVEQYTSAVNGLKDIVILFDRSASVTHEQLVEMKTAVKDIVRNLGARDRFNIISYSDRPKKFVESLEVANEGIYQSLDNFVDSIRTGGPTDLFTGLTEALELLKTFSSPRQSPVVMVLTSGRPTVGITDNTSLVEETNKLLGAASANALFYKIGGENDRNITRDLANGTLSYYEEINETTAIHEKLLQFSLHLPQNIKGAEIFTKPYYDSKESKVNIGINEPIFVEDELKGVIGIDLRLQDIINQFDLDEDSTDYKFIINNGGYTVFHPATLQGGKVDPSNLQKKIEDVEVDNPALVAIKEVAKQGGVATAVLEYPDQSQKIVSLVPLGTTGLIYGERIDLRSIIPAELYLVVDTLQIGLIPVYVASGVGLLTAIVLLIFSRRLMEVKKDE